MAIFDTFSITREQLRQRWHCGDDTLRRLEQQGTLTPISLPGKRVTYRRSDIEALESQWKGPCPGSKRSISADDALRQQQRVRETWDEFSRQLSPLDLDHGLIERMLAERIANDPTFTAEDVETFVAAKKVEYQAVREHAAQQAKESPSLPEMRRLVEGGAK